MTVVRTTVGKTMKEWKKKKQQEREKEDGCVFTKLPPILVWKYPNYPWCLYCVKKNMCSLIISHWNMFPHLSLFFNYEVWIKTLRNAIDTCFNIQFSTHSFWLIKIHMRPTKFMWDPHNLTGLVWILIIQKECIEKIHVKMCVVTVPLKLL